jgi:RNA polymerase sigma-70 factor (ECF subfamily)
MSDVADAELMLQFARDRDAGAFEQLYRRHKDALLRFLVRLSRDVAIAEEVSQQAWLKVIDAARRGGYAQQPGASFRTWLYTLARNHFIDEYRRKFAATRTEALDEEQHLGSMADTDPAGDPLHVAQQDQLAQRLQRALMRLPYEQREVIAMWAEDVDLASMVATIGAPRDTVLSRKKYAIAKLRAALSADRDTGVRHEPS